MMMLPSMCWIIQFWTFYITWYFFRCSQLKYPFQSDNSYYTWDFLFHLLIRNAACRNFTFGTGPLHLAEVASKKNFRHISPYMLVQAHVQPLDTHIWKQLSSSVTLKATLGFENMDKVDFHNYWSSLSYGSVLLPERIFWTLSAHGIVFGCKLVWSMGFRGLLLVESDCFCFIYIYVYSVLIGKVNNCWATLVQDPIQRSKHLEGGGLVREVLLLSCPSLGGIRTPGLEIMR